MTRRKSRRRTGSVQHGGYRQIPAGAPSDPPPPVGELLAELRRALDDRRKPIDYAKVRRLEWRIDEAIGM